jgi:hypothetical protein
MARTRRKGTVGLPPRGEGAADWQQLKGAVERTCPRCGKLYHDDVAVLEYLPDQDDGFQLEQYPGWNVLGWLAQWDCGRCGARQLEVVDTAQVARWGRAQGGWYRPVDGT